MKIRTRLTLLFTAIAATLLLVFAAVIYLSARENRENEFFMLLKREAITKANLFLNANVETQTLQNIYRTNRENLNEVEVAIYDSAFSLLYHDAVDIDVVKETPELLRLIHSRGETAFYQGTWQVVGLRHRFEGRHYIITAAALDQYGYRKLQSLLQNSILVFIVSIVFIYVAGRLYAKKAFGPVVEMTEKARRISATNLDMRLTPGQNQDELADLANTFNDMLARLEHSFDAQKQFVSNIAHELRTPLAALITELELATGRNRTAEEYRAAIQRTQNDAKKLTRLLNSLLDLAKASYDRTEIGFKEVRIDEALLDARQQVQQANPDYKIDIHFENDFDHERDISVSGNEYLLKTAFVNLFENGCKFSADHQSTVRVTISPGKMVLAFADRGIGIPEEDIPVLFTPFFRGQNRTFAEGHGVGLSLTKKIVQLHQASIAVASVAGQGTTFTVTFTTGQAGSNKNLMFS